MQGWEGWLAGEPEEDVVSCSMEQCERNFSLKHDGVQICPELVDIQGWIDLKRWREDGSDID